LAIAIDRSENDFFARGVGTDGSETKRACTDGDAQMNCRKFVDACMNLENEETKEARGKWKEREREGGIGRQCDICSRRKQQAVEELTTITPTHVFF
jgi:hypothetical protein